MPNHKTHTETNSRINEIRSDEVQEILSHVPNWMIRWGITLIFALIILLVGLSWIIKYPDTIQGSLILTTKEPPIELVSKSSGQISHLFVPNNYQIKKGEQIVQIQNPLGKNEVTYLVNLLPQIEQGIQTKKFTISFTDSNMTFGDIQQNYNELKRLISEYQITQNNDYQKKQIQNLKIQIINHKDLLQLNKNQLELAENLEKNSIEKYNSDRKLYEKGAISKSDFFTRTEAYSQTKNNIGNIKKTIVNTKISIGQLESQLNDLNYRFEETELKTIQNIESVKNAIQNELQNWQQNYILTAPFDGKVSYLTSLSENQFIQTGTPLITVIPQNNEYLAQVILNAQGYGKVKVGQTVNIKLDNYPYAEYGQLKGKIKEVSTIPNTNNQEGVPEYLAIVTLTNNLTTTYNKTLEYKPNMNGVAEIVTEDLRLIERIFSQFKKILDK